MFGMNPLTLFELLVRPEFLGGLVLGVAAAAVVVLFPRLDWFLAWAAAAIAGLAWAGLVGWSPLVPWWGVALAAIVGVFAAIGADVLARRHDPWVVPVLFAVSVLGVWGTVPDTERAGVLMGVTVGVLGALLLRRRIRVGTAGPILSATILGYVIVTDGAIRGGAVVGSLGALGMLVVAPATAVITRVGPGFPPLWLLACHVLHVMVSGRVAGRMHDPLDAAFVVAVSASVTKGLLWWGTRRSNR